MNDKRLTKYHPKRMSYCPNKAHLYALQAGHIKILEPRLNNTNLLNYH